VIVDKILLKVKQHFICKKTFRKICYRHGLMAGHKYRLYKHYNNIRVVYCIVNCIIRQQRIFLIVVYNTIKRISHIKIYNIIEQVYYMICPVTIIYLKVKRFFYFQLLLKYQRT